MRNEGTNLFSYYGSKSKLIHHYPGPRHARIIEPFAGSARYALRWFDRDVLLVDCRDVVIETWRYLQAASPADILGLPEPKPGDDWGKLNLSRGERLLLGWLAGRGASHPRSKAQQFCHFSRDKKSIAGQLYKIKHWKIEQGDYRDIPNQEATWFIDPPYSHGGHSYRTPALDYAALAGWCQSRQGQVIVCENTKADWLPFWPLRDLHGAQADTTEAIWSNHRTGFEATQMVMTLVKRGY